MAQNEINASGIYETIVPKVCSILILPLTSAVAGMLPITLSQYFYKNAESREGTTFDKVMSFFLYFGGGVLLCTIFLHLLPEITENVETLEAKKVMKKFVLSFPELVLCFGFFLMFLVEEVMHSYLSTPTGTDVAADRNGIDKSVFVVEKTDTCLKAKDDDGHTSCTEHEHINFDGNKNYHSCAEHHCHAVENGAVNHYHEHSHEHGHSHLPVDLSKSVFYGLLTVLALSVHELFEGLAVGLEPKASMVWYLLTAITCHKVVLAGFIGVQLVVTRVQRNIAYMYVIAFALTSPIGIVIGLYLSTRSPEDETLTMISVTLQAMATGTLLYIVFFEVYAKQFGTYKLPGVMKVLSSVIGFVFMSFLQVELST